MNRPLLLGTLVLFVAGCEMPAPAADGGADAPMIVFDGSVSMADAGSDAPPIDEDAPSGPCAMLPPGAPFTFLPLTCMPRCSAETRDAFLACGRDDRACITAALGADTTESVLLVDEFGPVAITCGTQSGGSWRCYDWQSYVCASEICPEQYAQFIDCLATGATCNAEGNALTACTRISDDFDACQDEHVALCFPPVP